MRKSEVSRRNLVASGMALSVLGSGWPARAQTGSFFGELLLRPLDDGRLMQLEKEFGYRDSANVLWPVPAGTKVDGASIPRAAWPFIGGPWEGRYRNASVVHDYYCDKRNRTSVATHRVFHEAMLTSGVSKWRADVMYTAVRVGGPKWSDTVVFNNGLAEVSNLFDVARPELDARARLAAQAALATAALEVDPLSVGRPDNFALVNASLPDAGGAAWEGRWGEAATATLSSGRSELTASVLGRRGDAIVLGFEEELPMTAEDFDEIQRTMPREGLSIEELDTRADNLELTIRVREMARSMRNPD